MSFARYVDEKCTRFGGQIRGFFLFAMLFRSEWKEVRPYEENEYGVVCGPHKLVSGPSSSYRASCQMGPVLVTVRVHCNKPVSLVQRCPLLFTLAVRGTGEPSVVSVTEQTKS